MAASISFSTMFCRFKSTVRCTSITVAWRMFLSAVKNNLLARRFAFDAAISILAMQIIFHRHLDALYAAMMLAVDETDDVTEH